MVGPRIEKKVLGLVEALSGDLAKMPIAITEGHLSLAPHNSNPILTEWLTGVYHARAMNLYQRHGDRVKIANLEFFGHSNKACLMFDYSNMIDSGSKAWLHEKEFSKIKRGIFTRDALVRSWGCHTGESMSQKFRSATGVPMWGLIGKSQYLTEELPIPSKATGRWVR